MIRFPEPAKKLHKARMADAIDLMNEAFVSRLEQSGLRMDAVGDDIDKPTAQGAFRAAAARLEGLDVSSTSGEVVNLAEEFYGDEIERNFREQGAKLVVNPPPISERAKKNFRMHLTQKTKDGFSEHLEFIEREVVDAIDRGRRAEDLATDFRERTDISKSKAELAARDVLGDMQSFQTKTRLSRVGIEQYRWLTSEDERVRDTHAAFNGRIFRLDQPPLVGHPGEDWLCRCDMQPIIKTS